MKLTRAVTHIRLCDAHHAKIATGKHFGSFQGQRDQRHQRDRARRREEQLARTVRQVVNQVYREQPDF
jgi:hypothetical protein